MPRSEAQIAAERARNARWKTVTIRFDEDEQRWLELLRSKMKAPSAAQAIKALYVREIVKLGIDRK